MTVKELKEKLGAVSRELPGNDTRPRVASK